MEHGEHRVTFMDIAREAGVDKSTVSLALSGHPRITAATRERVKAVAERLGYTPDPALSSLAAARWQGRRDHKGLVLAFVCDDLKKAEPELRACLAGVKRQAALIGYGVEVFSLSEYPTAAALLRVVRQRNLRGMVIGQSRHDLPEELFTAGEPPRVECGFLRDVACDTVRPDLAAAVNLAWRRLGGAGKRVVFYLELERGLHSDIAVLGAARALAESLGRRGPKVVVTWREEGAGTEGVPAGLAKADAVVVINGKQRARLLRTKAVAATVPVVPLHVLPGERGVGGVDLRLEDTGRVAVNLLELKMRRVPLATAGFRQTVEVEPRWVEAGATGED
jgi:DNA-binding LacI/PurR family transcriptional regulator